MNWDQQYAEGKGVRRWPSEALLGFLARRLTPGMKILDVGCGGGGNLRGMFGEYYSVVGIDSSHEAVYLAACNMGDLYDPDGTNPARRRWDAQTPYSWSVIQADIHALPFTPESFAAVVAVTTLQHFGLADKLSALREARRVLKPSGRLFVYDLGPGTVVYEAIFPGNPPIYPVAGDDWADVLREAGFDLDVVNRWTREYGGRRSGRVAVYQAVEARAR